MRFLLTILFLCALGGPLFATPPSPDLPRFELGVYAYQPADGFVNGSLRANHAGSPISYRLGYTPATFLKGDLQLHLDHQPSHRNNLSQQQYVASVVSPDWIKSQHSSLGLLWAWKYVAFGPEYRFERHQAVKGTGQHLDTIRLNRLWWRYAVGYISQPAPFRLVARLEIAGTNEIPSRTPDGAIPNQLRAFAPDHEYGLYAGVRF